MHKIALFFEKTEKSP